MPNTIEHDKYGKIIDRNIAKELVTCEHGMSGSCWWCKSTKNKSTNERFKILEGRLDVLKELLKLVITHGLPGGRAGYTGLGDQPQMIKRIDVGADADKPDDAKQLLFWYANDTDKIYQWRDSDWVDISYSRPDSTEEKRITDIVAEPGTEEVEITYTD